MGSHNLGGKRPPRLLLVDDEPAILRGLRRTIESAEPAWEIHCAKNGWQALQKACLRDFELVVTDLKMPIMDGVALMQRLERQCPNTIRILHTSQLETNAEQVRRLAHDILFKPASIAKVLAVIEQALGSKNYRECSSAVCGANGCQTES